MARYRKKPVEIEAVQFFNTNESLMELADFIGEVAITYEDPDNPKLKIETLEGTMRASEGDYIIRGIHGEFYPCKPDVFRETYDKVIEK